jgi:hypothetical protein
VGGAGAGVVEADGVAVVGPDVPEAAYEVVICVVVPHLGQQVAVADSELPQDGLERDQRQLGLEEVGAVQAVEAVGAENACWLLQHCPRPAVAHKVAQVQLHLPQFADHLVHLLIVAAGHLVVEVVVKVLQGGVNFGLDVRLQLLSEQSLAALADRQQVGEEHPPVVLGQLGDVLLVDLVGEFVAAVELGASSQAHLLEEQGHAASNL